MREKSQFVAVCVAFTAALCMLSVAGPRQTSPVLLSSTFGSADERATYEPTWESLSKHQVPEWFRDAKFGIYTHWGPITYATENAPSSMEWYARQMYEPQHRAFSYHRRRFGDQKVVGYKDVIPRFRAEKFEADEWAELFARAGAKFAGPVAIHHDNFAMWDSALTEWDSMDKGPRRDITGELAEAIRKRGMKFIATFHHGFAWQYYEPSYEYDAADGTHADLYCEPHEAGTSPSKQYLDKWLGMVNEVVGKYQPDLIWFDFGLGGVIRPDYQQRMFADYYNWAARHGRKVGVAHKHRNIHEHTGILDFERGREDRLTPYPWLTDTSVGPWFHHNIAGFRTVNELVDVLADIVSKNGCMLLNVGPKSDGTIPDQGKRILLGMGDWLKVNGEAIYNTRPWLAYGEGPTRMEGGAFSEERDTRQYTAEDLRFTRSKDGETLYVIVLDWPGEELTVASMSVDGGGPEAHVELLGYGRVDHDINNQRQLVLRVPKLKHEQRPCDHAFAFRLRDFRVSLHEAALFEQPEAIELEPAKATLEGRKIRVQVNEGRANIGYWDDAKERVHWLVYISAAGRYIVRGEFSSAHEASGLKLTVADQSRSADVPRTDGWFRPVFVSFGEVNFSQSGVYHIVLEPASPSRWRAVNVYRLQVAPRR